MLTRRFTCVGLAAALIITGLVNPALAADHLDSPSVMSDGRMDINDLYAFQSPENPQNVVLIMTVNPAAGVLSPMNFKSRARYEFLIDNDGDSRPDITFRVSFNSARGGRVQTANVYLNGRLIGRGLNEQTHELRGSATGGLLRCGLFEDPFFFDLNGFNDGFNFTGEDFFAGLNVTAICLEVPASILGGTNVGVWARTSLGGQQFDRMGRPAINTVLVKSERKDEYNLSAPRGDRRKFRTDMREIIESLNGGDRETARQLSRVLLPDLLTFDTSSTSGFLNGRQLADDVIDAELDLLTNGALTGDGVDVNDAEFLDVFPYLAMPHAP